MEQGLNLQIIIPAGLMAAVLALIAGRTPRVFPVLLGLMVFVASLSPHVTWYGDVYRTFLLPVQMQRSEIFLLLSAALLAGAMFNGRLLAGTRVPSQTVVLLLIAVYAGTLRFYHEGWYEGTLTLLGAMFTVPAIWLATSEWAQGPERVHTLMRALGWTGLAWIAGSFVQFVLDPSMVTTTNPTRFIGITGNAQNAAITLAPLAVISLWLGLNPSRGLAKFFWYGTSAILVILLLATGSRTGMLMLAVGTGIATIHRLGATALALPILAVFLVVLVMVAESVGFSLAAERVISTQDTRTDVWRKMFQIGMEHPFLGAGRDQSGGSENSFLISFASFGLLMVFFVGLLAVVSGLLCLRLWRARREMDEVHRPIVDLVIAYNAMFWAGAMFEGYILARIGTNLVYMLIMASVAAYLVVESRRQALGYAGEWEDAGEFDLEAADAYEAGGAWGERLRGEPG